MEEDFLVYQLAVQHMIAKAEQGQPPDPLSKCALVCVTTELDIDTY